MKVFTKAPAERRIYTVALGQCLAALVSATATVSPTTSPPLDIGAIETDGQNVSARVGGGQPGKSYRLTFEAGTDRGKIMRRVVRVKVRDAIA